MRIVKIAAAFIIFLSLIVILIQGKDLLIPFILALIIWFIIKETRDQFSKVKFVKQKFPFWLRSLISALFVFSILGLVIQMLSVNISLLSKLLPQYSENAQHIIELLNKEFGINISETFDGMYKNFDFQAIVGTLLSSITSIFSNTFMILLYMLFLFLEEFAFMNKIKAVYPQKERFERVNSLLKKVDKSIGSYLLLKTLVSVMTGVLSYIAMLFIGVDAALFWAFLIFLLNYIPTIGSLLGTLFPATFALMQYGELMPFVWVLIAVGVIQVIVGNIIEPKIMGDSLNISALVVIMTLSFWGLVWGVIGMILSVPITVIIIIICAEFPKTRFIAIMLSDKGSIGEKQEE
jgi:AI-2 transport protein TqsA